MYVELKNINKHFGNFKASDDVTFGIEKGKLIGLLGPSGSGKTTILRMIAGLETPDSGDIVIDGKVINNVPASKRGIGFVFQSYALFRYMTVFENIAFGLRVLKKSENEIQERVAELVKLIGLEGLEKRYPSQLSGGQRQRVAFARALAPNPQLLLLDEPFAAIDAKVRQELRHWLKEMIAKLGVTSIFVTHDQDEAIEVADEIIIMNKGRIDQIGKPLDVYSSPKTSFVASFFGQPSIFGDYSKFNQFDAIEGANQAIVRPEFVKVSKKNEYQKFGKSAQEGIITDVAFRGSGIELSVLVNGVVLTARRGFDEASVSVGEKVDVFVYRIFVTVGDNAYLLENKSMREPVVVI
ncbi:MAG: ABC transporter ATP-binding protein [Fibrobacter sp.]|nr:ABC transporter ATP-binding protein [Fibrobacter sp.]